MVGTLLRFAGGWPVVLLVIFAAAMWIGAGYQPGDAFWLRPVALVLATLAVGKIGFATPRALRAVRARREGVPVSGRVEGIEKRSSSRKDGDRHTTTRARFSYRAGTGRFEGRTLWGNPHRTALLAPGAEIDLRYLPTDPSEAFWIEDLGGAGGRRTSAAEYEELFDAASGESTPPAS